MKILKLIKANLFASFVLLAYLALMVFDRNLGLDSLKNSQYYLKEMIFIMPPIFILTALLDLWIPKETILKYLGSGSKAKGIFLSFLLGGISAGPIYAAFPVCVMLHKKGASIRNIVIILSSWAVIKVPMLLNEVKFLGVHFMVIRWILTVIAIIVFSWLTSLMVKDKDIPEAEIDLPLLAINSKACMGCRLCTKSCPQVFKMENGKATVIKDYKILDEDLISKAVKACPANAISYNPEIND